MFSPAFTSLWQRLLGHSVGKWLFLAGTSGVLCGLAALAFFWSTELLFALLVEHIAGLTPPRPAGDPAVHLGAVPSFNPWWLLLIMTLAGVLATLILRLTPEAAGAGTNGAIAAYHQHDGRLSLRTALVKFVASVITLGGGGSGGREGPIAMICSGINASFAQRVHLSSRDRRLLMTAGIAGGVGAIFQAPLAGALFAAECLYSDSEVESESLIPCFICAIIAYCTFALGQSALIPSGEHQFFTALFATPEGLDFQPHMVLHLIGFLAVAVAVVAGARIFRLVRAVVKQLAERLPATTVIAPTLGMFATGLVAVLAWQLMTRSGLIGDDSNIAYATLGSGYGFLQLAFDQAVTGEALMLALILVIMALLKVVTTALTADTGNSAGVFGPSLMIGGCLGGAVGALLGAFDLPIAPPVASCVLMGMAGFLAACFRTPLAALLMVSELTGNYQLLLPAMWVCAICFMINGRHRTILASQVPTPLDSPAHQGHFFTDILAGITVKDVISDTSQAITSKAQTVHTLDPGSSIDACKDIIATTNQSIFPLVDSDRKLCGIFNMNDLRRFLFDDSLALVAVAQDVAITADIITVATGDSLATTMRRFTIRNLEELPIVDGEGCYQGMLSRRQVIAYYNHVIDQYRAARTAAGYDVSAANA